MLVELQKIRNMLNLSQLAQEGDLDDTLLIGKRPDRKSNQPQELYHVDDSFPSWHKNHYVGTDKYLTRRAVRWYEEKTGFSLPDEHSNYFFSLPRGLTSKLTPTTKGDIKFECGIVFCHLDGEIYQYRPWEPIPTWEKVGTVWQPGRPMKYITIIKSVDGVTLPGRPLFLPKIKEIPNSPNILIVTEGFTKAACLSHLGFDSIHITGVTCWDTPNARKLLEEIKGNYDFLVLAFDMDSETNDNVKREQMKFSKKHGARIAEWTPEAKGFDDLCLYLKNDEYALRHIILSAKEPESDYFIPNAQTPYPYIKDTIASNYPTTYYDGVYWYVDHEQVPENKIKTMFIAELQKFYAVGDKGRSYNWATKYAEVMVYLETHMFAGNEDSCSYIQNGKLDQGEFTPSEYTDPRALPWTVEDVEEPTELINFLMKCHGNLNYRYWLRSLFDNSILYGAILGVTGQSGSGKSLTLRVAQSILTRTYCHSGSLSDILISERLSALGNPKAYIQSDCQDLPERMDRIFEFSDANDLSGRPLYSKSFSPRKFHCRIAYGYVNIQHNNSLNDGLARRSKIITCKSYPELKKDARVLSALLKDPTYLNRIFNWAIEADHAKTQEFMEPVAKDEINDELMKLPSVRWCDKVLLNKIPENPLSLEEFYDGFIQLAMGGNRKVPRYGDFINSLHKAGVPIHEGGAYQLPNGKMVSAPDTLGVEVHPEVVGAIRGGFGRISHINCRYMSTKKIMDTIPEDRTKVIVAFNTGEDNLWEEGETPTLYNPTIQKLAQVSCEMEIIQIIKFKRNKLNLNPTLRNMVEEFIELLPPAL